MKNTNPLTELFELYNNNISLAARELGCTRQDIYYWKGLGYIPHKRGDMIEEKTKGKIKASRVWQYAGLARKQA